MGIDLGQKKAAFSVWERRHRKITMVEIEAYVSDAIDRQSQLRDVSSFIYDAVEEIRPDYVFIEEPLVGRNVKDSLKVAMCYGAVLSDLGWRDLDGPIQLIPVNVGHWKKATVGKGNASKSDVASWLDGLDHVYSVLCEGDQDRIDAAAIGRYGIGLVGIAEEFVSDAG